MEYLSIVLLVGAAVVLYIFMRNSGRGSLRCTRCDGTGQVSERWPDPKEPGGWHIVEGTCPKCKGKGKI
jgi:DnaJ-class molecular chaperone